MAVRKLLLVIALVLGACVGIAAAFASLKGWSTDEWGTGMLAAGGFLISFGLFSFGGNTGRAAGIGRGTSMQNMLYLQTETVAYGGNSEAFRRTLHVRPGKSAFRWVAFLCGPALIGLGVLVRGLAL